MTTTSRIVTSLRQSGPTTLLATFFVVGIGVVPATAQEFSTPTAAVPGVFATPRTVSSHVAHALALSDAETRKARPIWWPRPADHAQRRWPLRADPRRWPRLFANTSECTLSFDPVRRRHWFR